MEHIKTLNTKNLQNTVKKGGCGECQTSCQSACKNFLYCRKSELREQIKQVQSNQLSSGVKSAAYSYD